jgi:pimeloyl-ACP methyl ester carboxylesterase
VSVDEHTIELAGSPVFYRRASGPEVPVVYLHGIPTSSDDWVPFLERTGGVAPDLLGFGRSGKGGHLDYSIEGHAGFIKEFLDRIGIDRVKLVVHDWGAAGGLRFAQGYPDRVVRLVVCNAIPLFDGFEWLRFARHLRRPIVGELLMGATTRGLFARTLRKGGSWSEQQIAELWRQFDQGTQRAILRLYRDATPQRLAEAGGNLSALEMPGLVLWGGRDPWLAPELGEQYADRLGNSTLEQLPEGRHWPWLDDPAAVDRVAEFVSGR